MLFGSVKKYSEVKVTQTAMLLVLLLLFAGADAQHFCKRMITLSYSDPVSVSFSPDEHQPWMSCLYIVTSPRATAVKLSCRDAKLRSGENCEKNRIMVSKLGKETMEDAVGHCGPTPFVEVSLRNQMVAQLQITSNIEPGQHVCTFSTEIALGSAYICAELLILQVFQNRTIFFEADHYQASSACRYLVRSPERTRVKLSCAHSNLPPTEFCDNDKILVSRTGDQSLANAVSHCGPAAFEEYSEKNELVVGMRLGVENVKEGGHYCTVSVAGFSNDNNTCERQIHLYGLNDTSNASLFPDEIKAVKSCRWVVFSPPDTRISVSCSYSYFPKVHSCSKDQISVYKMANDTWEPRVYCGNNSFTESSFGNELILELKISRAGFLSNGFYTCDFSVKDSGSSLYEGCDQIIHLTEEGQTAPLDSKPYSVQEPFQPHSCRYVIVSPPRTRVFLSCPLPIRSTETGYKENPCLGIFSIYKEGMDQTQNATEYCDLNGFADSSVSNELKVVYNVRSLSRPRYTCYASVITPDTPDEQECNCGRRNTARIIGGENTLPHEFPMMAAIASARNRIINCGAAIISHRYAVTVAHCVSKCFLWASQTDSLCLAYSVEMHDRCIVDGGSKVLGGQPLQAHEIVLVVGAWDLGVDEPSKQYIAIDQIIANQKYIGNVLKNEIALVHLKESLVFNQNVEPACLPFNHRNNLFVGEKVWLMGWGDTQRGNPKSHNSFMPNILQKIEVNVLSRDSAHSCNYSEDIMCTFIESGRGGCYGDSGAPVVWADPVKSKLFLVGLHVASDNCSLSWVAETRITYFLDWIEHHTQDAKFCRV